MREGEGQFTISVNGETMRVPPDTTVRRLLDTLGLGTAAVERNLALVPRAKHAETRLFDGDALEVVQLVGGG